MKTSAIVLDEWQKEVLDHKGNILLCTGRQIGKTTILAIKAGRYLLDNPGSQIIIVSLTEDQAKLIIVMIQDYLEKHNPFSISKGKDKPTQNKITLKNSSVIIARPVGQTGNSIRGFTGDVLIIDEAARMSPFIFAASKPTLLTTAGEIWIASTPFGKQGYFWDAYQNKGNRFKVFHISAEDVIRDRPISVSWSAKKRDAALQFLKDERAEMSVLEYSQEYLALFLDDLRQYFSDELIAKCCILKRRKPNNYNFLGVDIARLGNDKTTYEIVNKISNTNIHQVESIVKQKQLTTKTEQDILDLNRSWNLDAIGIDSGSGSLGVGIFDRLMENKETKRKVVPMNNRSISLDKENKKRQRIFKEDMYENMLALMEKGYLKLLDDDEIRLSLKSIQWELVDKGEVTKVRITGRDSHITEGLVRATWLAQKRKINKLWITCF